MVSLQGVLGCGSGRGRASRLGGDACGIGAGRFQVILSNLRILFVLLGGLGHGEEKVPFILLIPIIKYQRYSPERVLKPRSTVTIWLHFLNLYIYSLFTRSKERYTVAARRAFCKLEFCAFCAIFVISFVSSLYLAAYGP